MVVDVDRVDAVGGELPPSLRIWTASVRIVLTSTECAWAGSAAAPKRGASGSRASWKSRRVAYVRERDTGQGYVAIRAQTSFTRCVSSRTMWDTAEQSDRAETPFGATGSGSRSHGGPS